MCMWAGAFLCVSIAYQCPSVDLNPTSPPLIARCCVCTSFLGAILPLIYLLLSSAGTRYFAKSLIALEGNSCQQQSSG